MPRATYLVALVLSGLAHAGCGNGGGTITVPCEADRCDASCREDGNASGTCRADTCECRPLITPPGGLSLGVSSGGRVERRSTGYSVSLSVGPVEPAGEARGTDRELELGLLPMADPERGVEP